jgi:uncharacterized protein
MDTRENHTLSGVATQPIAPDFDLDKAVEHLSHWLPTQAPLKDFIHHNTLHAVQDRQFHAGIAIATGIFSAKNYLDIPEYQGRYRAGRISDSAIDWALAHAGVAPGDSAKVKDQLLADSADKDLTTLNLARDGLRSRWLRHLQIDLNSLTHPVLFRLLSSFLDQGISRWITANETDCFWDWIGSLVRKSRVNLYPFEAPAIKQLFDGSPDDAIHYCLGKLVGDSRYYEQYILEMLLAHPGWSGMVNVIQGNPLAQHSELHAKRKITVKELTAVDLILEWAFIRIRKGDVLSGISCQQSGLRPGLDIHTYAPEIPLHKRVWQEALEFTAYEELFRVLQAQDRTRAATQSGVKPLAQALFCLDDRECSIRRHVEHLNDDIETIGAPGFFGIDFMFQGLDDAFPVQQCPPILSPKIVVREVKPVEPKATNTIKKLLTSHLDPHSLVRGWLYTQTLGLMYSVRLAWQVFFPSSKLPGVRQLSEVDAHRQLHLLRESDEPTPEGYMVGFSFTEMADKIENLFRVTGLTGNFAPLVVLIAHGSSSVNNPHFAAYDCGACSGKPGVPNARAFAWMANHPTVRGILKERNILLPDTTHFVAALHNTSRDEISYFDLETLPEHLANDLRVFQGKLRNALEKNAKERCRWFELAPETLTDVNSAAHVRDRSISLFEPRPELNHSNNLYAIIANRNLTKHLFLDRRSFLHSYDHAADQEGVIAAKILSATVPICGGISMEYLFSRFDNAVYGAGTKLPHNVIGLIGVANGVEGDLRTGLPSQMIEVHEPVRILYLFQQKHDIMSKAFAKLTAVKEWVENEWLRVGVCEPDTNDIYLYVNRQWEKIDVADASNIPMANSSEQITRGKIDCIPAAILQRRSA